MPLTRPAAMPAMTPQAKAVMRCFFIRQRAMMTTGTTSMIRESGLGSTWAASRTIELVSVLVKIRKHTSAMRAAGMEYFIRERTTLPNSAFWVVAEAMVVSEMGARLSPNAAPETMAPII